MLKAIPNFKKPHQLHIASEQLRSFAAQLEHEYNRKKSFFGFFCPDTKKYQARELRKLAIHIDALYENYERKMNNLYKNYVESESLKILGIGSEG